MRALLLVVLACAMMPLAPGGRAPTAAAGPALELRAEGDGALVAAARPCRGKAAGIACGPDLFLAPPGPSVGPARRPEPVDRGGPSPEGILPAGMLDPPRHVRAI